MEEQKIVKMLQRDKKLSRDIQALSCFCSGDGSCTVLTSTKYKQSTGQFHNLKAACSVQLNVPKNLILTLLVQCGIEYRVYR